MIKCFYPASKIHFVEGFVMKNTTIITTECHFTAELRIYSSSTHNGYAIIKSNNPITKIGLNAGENADTLVIYGSNNEGVTWTEIQAVNVTSAYADYTVELNSSYTWLKIDVSGTNQVRINSITLTTGQPCEHTNTTTTTVDATCTEAGSTTVTCDDCGKTVSTETIDALGHTTDNGVCDNCDQTIGGISTPTTVTVNISEQGWTNETKYISLIMNDNVTVSLTGGTNTGKYYSSEKNWRIYQTESPTITILSKNGKSIVSVKITYTVNNNGVLTYSEENITSGTVVNVNAAEATFGVGNTGLATNGQVRITAIEVVYQ